MLACLVHSQIYRAIIFEPTRLIAVSIMPLFEAYDEPRFALFLAEAFSKMLPGMNPVLEYTDPELRLRIDQQVRRIIAAHPFRSLFAVKPSALIGIPLNQLSSTSITSIRSL